MDDWFDGGGSGKAADVQLLFDGHGVTEALIEIVQLGALLSLGTTSDGGAMGVTVTVDGRWRREYFRDADELQGWLAEALPAVRQARDALSASSASRKRPRGSRGL